MNVRGRHGTIVPPQSLVRELRRAGCDMSDDEPLGGYNRVLACAASESGVDLVCGGSKPAEVVS